MNLKKGDTVIKLLTVNGTEIASTATVATVDYKRKLFSTDTEHCFKPKDILEDGVGTYNLETGLALNNYIPNCTSRIVLFEG